MKRSVNSAQQIIMLEFNELCPSLLGEFMANGHLPNFQRLYDSSTIYTTDAEEPPPQLEPWIQWATIHSGMTYSEHGAFHLNDGRKIKQKFLGEILSDAGIRVGILGSMNSNYTRVNGYYIPDPWDADAAAFPHWLSPFYEVVAKQVQDSSRSDGLSKGQLLRFGTFMLRHGLRLSTIRAAIEQILAERRDPGVKWRRASLLERIQYDLFLRLNRTFKPQFATFFCNSTAHYQHYYWRNMHPEIFVVPPDSADHQSLQTAILYGYQQMDKLVGQFQLDFPAAKLVLCTALSQQPWIETTKCTYRPIDFNTLLDFAEVDRRGVDVKPVMAEEFHLVFANERAAVRGLERLEALHINGQRLMKAQRTDANIFTGCIINDPLAMHGQVVRSDRRARPFRELFHMVHSMRSGRHHPDGVLWIGDGEHRVVTEKARLIDLAPTLLARYGVAKPEHMHGEPLDQPQYQSPVLV
jgi:hypothetical protein